MGQVVLQVREVDFGDGYLLQVVLLGSRRGELLRKLKALESDAREMAHSNQNRRLILRDSDSLSDCAPRPRVERCYRAPMTVPNSPSLLILVFIKLRHLLLGIPKCNYHLN